MAKRKSKKASLTQVSPKDFSIDWDAGRNTCVFRHKSGKGGKLGSGVSDAISVFSDGGRILVLSINYPARYACLEAFKTEDGLDELVFAEPRDIDKLFGQDFASHSPKRVAERLVQELG